MVPDCQLGCLRAFEAHKEQVMELISGVGRRLEVCCQVGEKCPWPGLNMNIG